jgi:hypothetical protein
MIPGQSARGFPLPFSACNIPANVVAYSLNITVVPQQPTLGFLTVWPAGQPQPTVSTLNSPNGVVTANAAIVPAGANGGINIYVTNDAHVILDINGYFIPETNSSTQSTAIGTGASSAGSQNTAIGYNTLQINSSGSQNTATGTAALSANTSGNANLAAGTAALGFNVTGSANTAAGTQAMLNNLIGSQNTAIGYTALWTSTTGSSNTAIGALAMFNETGAYNTAVGQGALYNGTTGSSNISIGYEAGYQVTSGSNNIDIGSQGLSGDSNIIRIGTSGTHTSTYIAGIIGSNIGSGSAVLINSSGQLGSIQSSGRYKEDIHDMGSASDRLMLLRPVTFHYKAGSDDGTKSLHYGLIGEEVDSIYPELVVRGLDGQVESVQYHELPAMLLNEMQKQRRIIDTQSDVLTQQKKLIDALQKRLAVLETHLGPSR